MKAVIFANGEISDLDYARAFLPAEALVICCDGGLRHAAALGLPADVWLGDMDSLPQKMEAPPANISTIHYPPVKDQTDLELALQYALERRPQEILIFGGAGGRTDHLLTNCQLLAQACERGVPAWMIDRAGHVTVTGRHVDFAGQPGDWVSLIPFTRRVMVARTVNLRYSLAREWLYAGQSRGQSNEMTAETAAVDLRDGLAWAIYTRR